MHPTDGRSWTEAEFEAMRLSDLETRAPIPGLDYSDLFPEEVGPRKPPKDVISRLFDRFFAFAEVLSR
mgnify:CR=1 FL=1